MVLDVLVWSSICVEDPPQKIELDGSRSLDVLAHQVPRARTPEVALVHRHAEQAELGFVFDFVVFQQRPHGPEGPPSPTFSVYDLLLETAVELHPAAQNLEAHASRLSQELLALLVDHLVRHVVRSCSAPRSRCAIVVPIFLKNVCPAMHHLLQHLLRRCEQPEVIREQHDAHAVALCISQDQTPLELGGSLQELRGKVAQADVEDVGGRRVSLHPRIALRR